MAGAPMAQVQAQPVKQSGILNRAWGVLPKIYNRLPLVPFLDRSTSAILYASMAAYLLFLVFMVSVQPNAGQHFSISESPIQKNARLGISPGESYVYALRNDGQVQRLQYDAQSSLGCRGVLLQGSDGAAPCILDSGNLASDTQQYNSSFDNESVILFLPWMLAVSGDFSWNVVGDYRSGYFAVRTTTNYTSLGKTSALGREAYRIRIVSDLYPEPAYYYIDSQKRVLLYLKTGNATASLVLAPFALNQSDVPN